MRMFVCFTCVHMCLCGYVRMCVCTYVWACVCMHACIACVCVCMYCIVCECVCVCESAGERAARVYVVCLCV